MTKLSIIIPSFCSQYIDEVIESARFFNPYEIIVIDSSPIKPNIKNVLLFHQSNRLNAAAARNKGASLAKGDLLLFIDSDVVLSKKIKTIENELSSKEENNIICGLYQRNPRESIISRFQRGVIESRLSYGKNNNRKIWSSSHFLIRKNAFILSGGFNETFDYYEDVEFFLRCEVFGLKIILDKSFRGIHLKEFNLITLIKDYWVKTSAAVEVRLKLPNLFKGNNGNITPLMHLSGLLGVSAIFVFLYFFFTQRLISEPKIILDNKFFLLILIFASLYSYPSFALKVSRIRGVILWTVCYLSILLSLIYSQIKFFFKQSYIFLVGFFDYIRNGSRVFFRNGRPIQIINYVTSRCNLRCSHCFYKESLNNPDPGEIPRKNLINTMRDIGPVLWYSLAGGEPFIRTDLEDLILDVHKNCRPKVFSFPTNGWYTDRTFKTTLRVLQRLKRGNLILFFSLDGPKLIHNQIRGEGSFENLTKTIDKLRPLKKIYNNLYINFILTVTPQNSLVAPDFIKEITREFKANSISINLYREHTPNAPKLPKSLIEAYEKTVKVYAEEVEKGNVDGYKFIGRNFLRAKEIVQKEMIIKVAKNNEFVTPCTAGTLSYIIMEDGKVKPCEILNDAIGNIYDKENSFVNIVKSSDAKTLRKWIRDSKCRCTYECAMSTNTLFSLPIIPKLLAKTLLPEKLLKKIKKSF